MYIKYRGKIIPTSILIYSSSCALHFMLPAWRSNFTEVALITWKVERVCASCMLDTKIWGEGGRERMRGNYLYSKRKGTGKEVVTVKAKKVHWGRRGIAPLIMNIGTRWGLASCPGCFTPGKSPPGTRNVPGLNLDCIIGYPQVFRVSLCKYKKRTSKKKPQPLPFKSLPT